MIYFPAGLRKAVCVAAVASTVGACVSQNLQTAQTEKFTPPELPPTARPDTSETKPAKSSTCGLVTPTYYYFTEIAPSLDYPHSYAAQTSESFTLKNIDKWGTDNHYPVFVKLHPSPSVYTQLLDKAFTHEEILCWSGEGDQLASAAMVTISDENKAVRSFYKYLNAVEYRDRPWAHDFYAPSFNSRTNTWERHAFEKVSSQESDLKDSIHYLNLAAEFREDYCPVDPDEDNWKDLQQCQKGSMFAVFANGLPSAHAMLGDFYAGGPLSLRDKDKAKYHWILSELQRGSAEHPVYTCDNFNFIKSNLALKNLFFDRLNTDAFFQFGLGDNKNQSAIRARYYEDLSKCL